jgi:hypothetical protein
VSPVLGPEHVDSARAIAIAVLSERQYGGQDPAPDFLARFGHWLSSLLERIGEGMRQTPTWVTWLIVVWVIGTLLAITLHALYGLFQLGGGLRNASPTAVQLRGELLGISDLDFERVYAEALAARDAKNWERAVRYGYAACILWLDRVGRVAFESWKTNRDYVTEIDGDDRSAPFCRATGVFEGIAYGGALPTETDASSVLFELSTLRHEPVSSLAR